MNPQPVLQTPSSVPTQPIVQTIGIHKHFGAVHALKGVDFSLYPGEVHILAGANGAGKSTLAKIISGIHQQDQGTVLFKGREVQLSSRGDALNLGIAIVTQESSLVPDLTIAENIFIHELRRGLRIDFPALTRKTWSLLQELEADDLLHPQMLIRDLSVAQQQLIEIAKALALNAELVIFDEPTASLSPREVNVLFGVIRKLLKANKGLIYVSHRIEEIYALADRISVLRDGQCVAQGEPVSALPLHRLVQLMADKQLEDTFLGSQHGREARPPGSPRMVVHRVPHGHGHRKGTFTLYNGQITGLAGLVGSGRTRFARSLFGSQPGTDYRIELDGQPVEIRSPKDAVRHGIAFVPEDRRRLGLIKDLDTLENAVICDLARTPSLRLDYNSRVHKLRPLLERFDLKPEVLERGIFTLSGGMQQKVVLIKWLLLQPRILILDEPTRGVDVVTRSEIYDVLRDLRDAGMGILVISSDFQELLAVCDRIVVMSEGSIVADLEAEGLDEEKLLMYALPRRAFSLFTDMVERLRTLVGGPAFWAMVSDDRVYCIEGTEDTHLLGFGAGSSAPRSACAIPDALTAASQGLAEPSEVAEGNGSWRTLLIPLRTDQSHDMGVLGVSVAGAAPLPQRPEGIAAALGEQLTDAVQLLAGFEHFNVEVSRDAAN